MADIGSREYVFLGVGILLVAALAVGASIESSSTSQGGGADDWQDVELKNVNSGENYTIRSLEKPVLVESFAVWCPTCTRQQQEIKKLHNGSDVTSVSLDVDPNEDVEKVKQHTKENGFDWHYSVVPSEMTRMLVNEYGNSIAHPPSAPAILVCEDSTRKLPNGVKPVSKLQEEIEKGC
jgi:thiol-disulfide isomerase/thioredoxin